MEERPPLSGTAKAAGHRLYQALYGPISEGVELTTVQAQAIIDRLMSPDVSINDLVRAAMAEANFRRSQANDDDSAQTAEGAIAEPSGRMLANMDVVNLLQETQIARWDAEDASHPALP
jgi:hypothetical protein